MLWRLQINSQLTEGKQIYYNTNIQTYNTNINISDLLVSKSDVVWSPNSKQNHNNGYALL